MSKSTALTWVIFTIIISLIVLSIPIYKYIQFDRQCAGYLKRAADANRIPLAKEQLRKALDYIEQHNLTQGYTSACWTTPDEDMGFWHQNLTEAYMALDQIKPGYTQLEESNVLMKLRETLLDGESLTIPAGISRYPFNLFWGIVISIFVTLGSVSLFALFPICVEMR